MEEQAIYQPKDAPEAVSLATFLDSLSHTITELLGGVPTTYAQVDQLLPDTHHRVKAAIAGQLRDIVGDLEAVAEAIDGINNHFVQAPPAPVRLPAACQLCGCTESNCEQCVEAQGYPCDWAETDLCTRCANEQLAFAFAEASPARQLPVSALPTLWQGRVPLAVKMTQHHGDLIAGHEYFAYVDDFCSVSAIEYEGQALVMLSANQYEITAWHQEEQEGGQAE